MADETAYLAISLGVHRSKKVSGGIKKKRHCLLHTACIFSSVRRDDEALQNVMHIQLHPRMIERVTTSHTSLEIELPFFEWQSKSEGTPRNLYISTNSLPSFKILQLAVLEKS